jgi:hypothetical protein
MNHRSNYRIQQQTANQNAAFVGERGKYKIPGLACRPTILPLGLHAGYTLGMAYLHIFLFFTNYLYTVKQDQFAILLIIIKQTNSIIFSKFKFNDWGEPERAPQFGGSSSSSAMYYGALYTLCVRTVHGTFPTVI